MSSICSAISIPVFFFFKNADHPFLKTVLQLRLATSLNYLIVSSDDSFQGRPWGFLKEVVDTIEFLKTGFLLEFLFNVTRKKLSAAIIESIFPIPLYRSYFPVDPQDDVLYRVKKMSVPPSTKSFFFKLHTSTLPVKTWLHSRGIFVPWTVNCRLCNKPETIEHCFIYCNNAFFFWDVLQRTLKKDLDITDQTIRFLPFSKGESVPYDIFVILGLHSLWRCRMIDRNAEAPRTTKSIFVENMAQLRSVYAAQPSQPDWFPLLDACIGLPDF